MNGVHPWPLRHIAFVGLGLIGSSLARLIREQHLAEHITACSQRPETLQQALQLGLIDAGYATPAEAVRGAQLIILAMPVNATEAVLSDMQSALAPDAVITDVGSTKGNVVAAATRLLGQSLTRFVPGHPIAGSEQSGVMAGRAHLFARHKVILTPLPETAADALAMVTDLWRRAGADVLTMDVDHHDAVAPQLDDLAQPELVTVPPQHGVVHLDVGSLGGGLRRPVVETLLLVCPRCRPSLAACEVCGGAPVALELP